MRAPVRDPLVHQTRRLLRNAVLVDESRSPLYTGPVTSSSVMVSGHTVLAD